jgi:hypothetical protein
MAASISITSKRRLTICELDEFIGDTSTLIEELVCLILNLPCYLLLVMADRYKTKQKTIMKRIFFVCGQNKLRSPEAESVFSSNPE